MNRLREWVVRQQCQRKGHKDFGCWAETGALGDWCSRCGRIDWQYSPGGPAHTQAPNYPTLYTAYAGRRFKRWWK